MSTKHKEEFIKDYLELPRISVCSKWGFNDRKVVSLAKEYGIFQRKKDTVVIKPITNDKTKHIIKNRNKSIKALSADLRVSEWLCKKYVNQLKEQGLI